MLRVYALGFFFHVEHLINLDQSINSYWAYLVNLNLFQFLNLTTFISLRSLNRSRLNLGLPASSTTTWPKAHGWPSLHANHKFFVSFFLFLFFLSFYFYFSSIPISWMLLFLSFLIHSKFLKDQFHFNFTLFISTKILKIISRNISISKYSCGKDDNIHLESLSRSISQHLKRGKLNINLLSERTFISPKELTLLDIDPYLLQ